MDLEGSPLTYTSIMDALRPINDLRAARDQITLDSLRVHDRRHFRPQVMSAYWASRFEKELRKAVRGNNI
jgi:hypothetical protein